MRRLWPPCVAETESLPDADGSTRIGGSFHVVSRGNAHLEKVPHRLG